MRSEPLITVTCDKCHVYSTELGLTATAGGGYDERNVDAELESYGWRLSDGGDTCPDCVETEQEEEPDYSANGGYNPDGSILNYGKN